MKKYFYIITLAILSFLTTHASDRIKYPYPFNPVKGLVNDVEKPYRQELCLNGKWDFMPVYDANASDFKVPAVFKKENVAIKIPSPWNVNNFTDGEGGDFITYPSYPKEWEKAQIGWMRKNVSVPSDWNGKQIILHFEGVMGKTEVYVNGQKAAENFELFLPFEADITQFIKAGQENEILVGVAKGSLFDDHGKYGRRTYVGGSMWGIEMAGIWQDVYMFAYNPVYVEDMFIQPDVQNKKLKIEIDIHNTSSQKKTISLDAEVRKWYNLAGRTINESPEEKSELAKLAALVFPGERKVILPANTITKITIEQAVTNELEYWTPDTPNLYGLVVNLKENKKVVDKKYDRFGWRQFTIDGNRLLLNGEQISLRGDSWHFMGVPQMTRRYPWAWFSMLKDANANAVRFHAQPFPRFYLDVADEMGICVLDETGIWSSDGGPKIDSDDYWESCAEHIRRLIKRDKNHASVFGWSVCNETVPVAVHVFKAPEELVQKQLDEINRWVKITADMDPTRPWISGDGETDRPTDLPTVIGHYGGMDGMKKWSSAGKPWGIGEQSMAYYGTPKQASEYNGNRAYESMLGRMEGVAIESYDLIKTQRELNASYSCIFNLAWYALQPLNLGMKDTSRPPVADDGIFFGFEEGGYGMQPERLGPYTTTLNPGYDASLPLYRTWPLFEAVRNANATPILPYSGKIADQTETEAAVTPVNAILLYASQESLLKESLENLGLKILSDSKPTDKTLIIIDGANPPANTKEQQLKLQKAIDAGASIFVMGMSPQSKDFINTILPFTVSLNERVATSFLKEGTPTLLQGLNHADFYFSELIPRGKTALHHGMAGDFAMKSTVLLRACNTDWQRWNYRAETSKTGNVFRSEQEAKGSDIVIASLKAGKSEIILSTLDLSEIALETQSLMAKILANMGATVSNDNIKNMQALDSDARLHKALILGSLSKNTQTTDKLLSTDFINGEANIKPELNTVSDNMEWKVATSDDKGIFSLSKPERDRVPVAYMSFWIYSPRSLSNLLAEPDMPSMDMYVATIGGYSVYLNGNKITSNAVAGNIETKVSNIMLDKGWNHMIIKLACPDKEVQIKTSIRFESADKNFMKQILSSVVR
ncbi:glycoside hydrolase family 2 protein [Prevotella sp. 10(H)]|uniref:glycoside hydrolase family 2 protein n=1 Tax=Prevotella sp. 10(H) TaxID=1158294 RepID=UPI00068F3E86|nr:glycoside hydrolase family 2 [Prevotella sp. 10(H)]